MLIIISILLINFTILTIFVPNTTSNENLANLQRFLPISDDDFLSTNQRFKQIMQGSGSSDLRWKDPNQQVETIDVSAELDKLNFSHIYQPDWPAKQKKLGAVSAVSFDNAGNVIIFHRDDRIWNSDTFENNYFKERHLGPISVNTVIAYGQKSGKVIYEWGKNKFYMPHGLTVDNEDNVWLTDVALHQVFKFAPKGAGNEALLTLGKPFQPGHTNNLFCKPTSVAVLPNGDFFVADGYCNSRIMKFSKAGELLLVWGKNTFHGEAYDVSPMNFFAVPHALTLAPELDLICVADRENGRVQCFYTNNGTSHSQYHSKIVGDRLYSVAYAPVDGGQLYVVNGPTSSLGPNEISSGFIIDIKTKNVLSKFAPNDGQFYSPHDIAVTKDGNEIYVAEIDPNRIHKFISKKLVKKISISSATNLPLLSGVVTPAKPTATVPDDNDNNDNNNEKRNDKNSIGTTPPPGSTALLVIILILIFGLMTFGMVILISRRRKRGCFPFGVRNRRHAWDFPTGKSDSGFKLGNLLSNERKHGFEKLDQNASDEEPDATTNMLTSAQFA